MTKRDHLGRIFTGLVHYLIAISGQQAVAGVGWITRTGFHDVSRVSSPVDRTSRVSQIRLTSPEKSKPDNLYKNKITQPLTSAKFSESDHTPPE